MDLQEDVQPEEEVATRSLEPEQSVSQEDFGVESPQEPENIPNLETPEPQEPPEPVDGGVDQPQVSEPVEAEVESPQAPPEPVEEEVDESPVPVPFEAEVDEPQVPVEPETPPVDEEPEVMELPERHSREQPEEPELFDPGEEFLIEVQRQFDESRSADAPLGESLEDEMSWQLQLADRMNT